MNTISNSTQPPENSTFNMQSLQVYSTNQFQTSTPNPSTAKKVITIILLLLFFPIGIFLMFLWMKWPTWIKISVSIGTAILGIVNIIALYIGITSFIIYSINVNCTDICKSAAVKNECIVDCTNSKLSPSKPIPSIPYSTYSVVDDIDQILQTLPYEYTYKVTYDNDNSLGVVDIREPYIAVQVVSKDTITADIISEIGKNTCTALSKYNMVDTVVAVEIVQSKIGWDKPLIYKLGDNCQAWIADYVVLPELLPFGAETSPEGDIIIVLSRFLVALEAYFYHHQKFPSQLEQLVPEYMNKIPSLPKNYNYVYTQTNDNYSLCIVDSVTGTSLNCTSPNN